MKDGLTIKDSEKLYGLGILLMMFHHLFCNPTIYSIEFSSIFGRKCDILIYKLAIFSKLCVAIFAFVSGYGFCKSFKKNYFEFSCKRYVGLLKKYWLVCVFFIPFHYLLNKPNIGISQFLLSILGLSKAYNGEWWYISQYLVFLLYYPLIVFLIDTNKKKKHRILLMVSFSLLFIGLLKVPSLKVIYKFLKNYNFFSCYVIIFAEGIFAAKYNVFQRCKPTRFVSYCLLMISIIARMIIVKNANFGWFDVIIIFPFILGFSTINMGYYVDKILSFFGKNSTYIWLTHTFYCYYYFSNIILWTKTSELMLLELVVISTVTAVVLKKIEFHLRNLIIVGRSAE